MADLTSSTSWMARGTCVVRCELPWTTDEHLVDPDDAATMRAICGHCPVMRECGLAVRTWRIRGGWWAGHDRSHPHPDHDNDADSLDRLDLLDVPATADVDGGLVEWVPTVRDGVEQGAWTWDGAA